MSIHRFAIINGTGQTIQIRFIGQRHTPGLLAVLNDGNHMGRIAADPLHNSIEAYLAEGKRLLLACDEAGRTLVAKEFDISSPGTIEVFLDRMTFTATDPSIDDPPLAEVG